MLIKHVFAVILTFFAGAGVSAGTFAFILVIGIIPRILQRIRVNNIMLIENITVLGAIAGNLSSIYEGGYNFGMPRGITVLYGFCTGMFVGCIAVALAEILHTFPIIFARIRLKQGLKKVIFCMAFGKMLGCIFYFANGYMNISP